MSTSKSSAQNATDSSQTRQAEQVDNFQKAALGLGLLRNLGDHEQEEIVRENNRQYREGNMTWWRQRLKDRFGVTIPEPKAGDDVGSTVRVDSPDQHYHYPPRGGLLSDIAKLAIAAALGAGGLAAWSWYNADKPPAQVKPVLDPGGLKIDVERPK